MITKIAEITDDDVDDNSNDDNEDKAMTNHNDIKSWTEWWRNTKRDRMLHSSQAPLYNVVRAPIKPSGAH